MDSAGDRQILLRRDERPQGAVATVTVNNPQKLNAMNGALMDALAGVFCELGADAQLRAVVLTGAGAKSFIAGADINEMAAINNAAEATAFITRLHRVCGAIRNCPVPVVARIQGYAFGAGLEIAAACDVRIAADTASFGMQEVKLGIPSVIEAALLPTLVGFGRAREIMYLGETFGSADALAWGLVEHVVPAATLDAKIEDWIGKLLTSAPGAVRLQKQLIRQWEDLPLTAAIEAGIGAFAASYGSDEPRATMAKFLAARQARKKDAS